jgi:hypothetical protein
MYNQNYNYLISQLTKRIDQVEELVYASKKEAIDCLDWENATLMKRWGISLRTAANYRKQGLGYFKRGGRVYYSHQNRIDFLKFKKKEHDRN